MPPPLAADSHHHRCRACSDGDEEVRSACGELTEADPSTAMTLEPRLAPLSSQKRLSMMFAVMAWAWPLPHVQALAVEALSRQQSELEQHRAHVAQSLLP
jgi:hypothetical protein